MKRFITFLNSGSEAADAVTLLLVISLFALIVTVSFLMESMLPLFLTVILGLAAIKICGSPE